jgi:hypothetical protein
MGNLKNSSQIFWFKYGEFMFLTETIRDKLFLAISKLYFFNLTREVQVDFS